MLLDDALPVWDADVVVSDVIDAPPPVAWDAVLDTNLAGDALIMLLGSVRDLPNRLTRRGRAAAAAHDDPVVRFGDLVTKSVDEADPDDPLGAWVPLGVDAPSQFAAGLVGRFWERDYGTRVVAPEAFAAFAEPDWVKTAIGVLVLPYGRERSLVVYESRTVCTDEQARRHFARYWRLVGPGAKVMMRRGLDLIGHEAESRASLALDEPHPSEEAAADLTP